MTQSASISIRVLDMGSQYFCNLKHLDVMHASGSAVIRSRPIAIVDLI